MVWLTEVESSMSLLLSFITYFIKVYITHLIDIQMKPDLRISSCLHSIAFLSFPGEVWKVVCFHTNFKVTHDQIWRLKDWKRCVRVVNEWSSKGDERMRMWLFGLTRKGIIYTFKKAVIWKSTNSHTIKNSQNWIIRKK